MARLVRIVTTVLAGLALGLGATYVAVSRQPLFDGVRSGAWTAWPKSGSPGADPYTRAVFARDGRIPLAAGSGLRFLATTDDAGSALTGWCTYAVSGPTASAQFWTLTLLDPRGFPVPNSADRLGFTSGEVLRSNDGAFTIAIAAEARPGNWLPSPGEGRFQLMLSFYDTPLSTAIQTGSPAPPLPSVTKISCR